MRVCLSVCLRVWTMPVVDEEKGDRAKWKQLPPDSAEFMDVMKRRRSCPLPPHSNCQLINQMDFLSSFLADRLYPCPTRH